MHYMYKWDKFWFLRFSPKYTNQATIKGSESHNLSRPYRELVSQQQLFLGHWT